MLASIVGASGYAGGELLRLLLAHPDVEVGQITSEQYAGKLVHKVHPNLRKVSLLKFSSAKQLEKTDVLFLALPHGVAMRHIDEYTDKADRIIDLSADFRLKHKEDYPVWYGNEHPKTELLNEFVYGIPELHREEMKSAKYISSAGCLATATILGLYPLLKNRLVDPANITVEGKMGSSGSGNKPGLGSHHAERSHAVRSFKPTLHRHTAEIEQELTFGNKPTINFSATAIELVRGILTTSHVHLKEEMSDKEIWGVYRNEFGEEPFIRIVKETQGVYRYPEPKILAGSNYCDIGFEKDTRTDRVVIISAIDNLMKGAAGQALQAMNIMCGLKETAGLEFPGLHPI